MKVIAIANQKGGCGKTITAVNLAGALSVSGKKVLFIDLDPQSHATSAFGMVLTQSNFSSYAIFDSFLSNEDINLTPLMRKKHDNLYVIGSHLSLSTMEQKMADVKNAILVISQALKTEQAKEFDYVIIDTPPHLGFLTLNALHATSRLIVPLDISLFSLRGVLQIKEILSLSKSMGFEVPKLSFLITLYDKRSNFAKNFLIKAHERFGKELLKTIIRPNIKLREAALMGKNIFEYDSRANGAIDYSALAKEIAPDIDDKPLKEYHHVSEKPWANKAKFIMNAPEANSVYVVGDFNRWTANESSLMKKNGDGAWVKLMSLSEGSHVYKFVVDGKWIEDPGNNNTEINEFGSRNSRVVISSKAGSQVDLSF